MKKEFIYFRIVLVALIAFFTWGLFCPLLISAEDDFLAFFGLVLIFVVPVLGYWIIKPIFKHKQIVETTQKQTKNEKNA